MNETLIPHSVEAEEAVIGSILINPDAYLEVASFLRLVGLILSPIMTKGWDALIVTVLLFIVSFVSMIFFMQPISEPCGWR